MNNYREQLNDPRWQKKRREIMARDRYTCQNCNDNGITLAVHHKHYKKGHAPWEYDNSDLVTLCEYCHNEVHNIKNDVRKIYKEFTNHNIIGVAVEHNGEQYKDSFVRIRIKNHGCTMMEVNGAESEYFELHLKGGAERETFLDAFKMIVKELEENSTVENE